MLFISPSDHDKLIKLFHSSIAAREENSFVSVADEEAEMLKADVNQLQAIAEEYKNALARLQDLAREYKIVFQRTKVSMRKRQIKLNNKKNRAFSLRK